jgi:protein arginine kinase activator
MTIVHLCQHCEKNPATVRLVKMQQGKAEQVWLCQDCAVKESPYSLGGLPLPPWSAVGQAGSPSESTKAKTLEDVLASFFSKGSQSGEAGQGESQNLSCEVCKLPFEAYRSTLLLGCPGCYRSFAPYLRLDLRKFHGQALHRGRTCIKPTQIRILQDSSVSDESMLDTVEAQRRKWAWERDRLRQQLREAADAEDFRLAAQLKIEILEVEKRLRDLENADSPDSRIDGSQTASDDSSPIP